jgi:hypothetical protein
VKTIRWRCLTWNGTVYPWEIHRLVRQWAMRSGCVVTRDTGQTTKGPDEQSRVKGRSFVTADWSWYIYIYIRGETAPSGPGPRYRGSWSDSDTPHSVGLWTSDQPDADLTTHDTYERQISILPLGIRARKPAKRAAADTSGGIRTRKPDKRAATDPHLIPHGHWNRVVAHINWYDGDLIESHYWYEALFLCATLACDILG